MIVVHQQLHVCTKNYGYTVSMYKCTRFLSTQACNPT